MNNLISVIKVSYIYLLNLICWGSTAEDRAVGSIRFKTEKDEMSLC